MKLLQIVIALLSLSTISMPQENNSVQFNDTIKSKTNSVESLIYQLDEFEFYKELTEKKKLLFLNKGTAKLWLNASLNFSEKSPFEKENNLTPGYLHSSLYDQYLENSRFNPIRTALGMIQAGAAGYLAYRHIKKWVIKK